MAAKQQLEKPEHAKYDNLWLGVLVGFLLPAVVFGIILWVLSYRLHNGLALRHSLLFGGTLPRLVAISAFANAIPHAISVRKEWWRACRGLILSTIVLALSTMVFHLSRGTM